MPTISLTVLPAKALKNGRNKVRIAVAHNSQTRYIVTDVVIDSPKEWKNGQIVRRDDAAYLNTRLRSKLNEVQRLIDEVPYQEGLTCAELIDTATRTKAERSHTLRSAFEEMLSVCTAKPSSLRLYRTYFNSIATHISPDTPVRNITQLMVRKYIKKRSDLAHMTVQAHVMLLARLIKYCQQNGYTDFRTNPANGCIRYVTAVRQSWLTPDDVRRLRDADLVSSRSRRFRDLFMLSYYLGGINVVDLLKVDLRGKTIKYVRTKTERAVKSNPVVEFDIPDEARPIIAKYMCKDGRLKFFNGTYMSGMVANIAAEARRELGIPQMTYYSARKSFAQHAFSLGVSEAVIDYILGHSLNVGRKSTIYAYIKVTPAMASTAIRKVLDFLNGNNNFD